MCGRFTRNYTWAELHRLYSVSIGGSNLQPRYNIFPTTTVDAVVYLAGTRQLVPMRWGIIPNWWSKPLKELRLATFNAPAETVAQKPMFRDAFRRNRCIIPASGYYEWQDTPGGKQPYHFTRRDADVISIAGIWDEWKDPESGEIIKSCAMIITEANKLVAEIHDRMPVVLEQYQFQPWLTGIAGLEVLKAAGDDVLQKCAVSKRVNSSRTSDDDPTLIEPTELAAEAPITSIEPSFI